MHDWDGFLIFLLVCFVGGTGAAIAVFVAGMIGFFGDIYKIWQDGRELAQIVTEKEHKRRLELLAKMIELQQAMQREAETKDQGDIDAAGKTEESRKISATTLAALNPAYPNEPVSPMALAEMKRGDG